MSTGQEFGVVRVGVIGVGQMGLPIAGHLLDDGFEVIGFDLSTERLGLLEQAGGQAASSPAEVAGATDVVLTSLPKVSALPEVLSASDGLLAAGREDLVIVETSTFDLDTKAQARDAAEAAGATLLDCPLSGTALQAQTKDLVVFVSGDEQAAQRCAPVFAGFARGHHYLGEFGNGSKMKYLANLMVTIHNAAAAEVLTLAAKAGMSRQTVFDILTQGAGTSRMLEIRGPSMVDGDYDRPGMSGEVFAKDLGIIDGFARSVGCPTPLFGLSSQIHRAAVASGYGKQDAAAVCAVLEGLAGVTRD